jgi:hypothetical protein
MKRTPLAVLVLTALVAFGTFSVRAADGEMSLELYQKIKAHFDAMYGANVTLLAGAQPRSRAEVEKDLRADVATNKDALFAALKSSKTIHRELSAQALQYCEDKKGVITALSKLVTDDPETTVRRAAAGTLAKVPDAEAVDALVKGLGDSSEAVRGICATALGNVKDTRASEPLLKVINDDDNAMVRLQAAMAMSKIKDPVALDPLKAALEKEKDERVKMAIAGAIRAVMGGNQAKEDEAPTADQAANELAGLASEMKEVETKLREDRHDQAVQVQGKGIEDKLQTLIEKIEKSCSQSSGSGQKQGQQQQPGQPQSGNKNNNGNRPNTPLSNSQLGGPVPPGATNAAMVAGKQDAWAKLPPAQRDELLQAFREDIPERWRKRLEAYFTSVASEEVKNENK